MVVDFDRAAFAVFGWDIYWYGLMYLAAFISAWLLARYRAKQPASGWSAEQVDDLLFYGGMGVILGGRLGYILFYNFSAFINDPAILFAVRGGGMSFHGGLLGVMGAMWLFKRKYQKGYFTVMDFVAPWILLLPWYRWDWVLVELATLLMPSCGARLPACPGAWFSLKLALSQGILRPYMKLSWKARYYLRFSGGSLHVLVR
jgi:hypothetical protein